MFRMWSFVLSMVLWFACPTPRLTAQEPSTYAVGVAKIDVTPDYPVRLSGFGFRRTESEGVTHKIWAKALAIGDSDPAVLIAVDNLGIPYAMVQEVGRRLDGKAKLKAERLAITASHTHTAPMLKSVAPTLFGQPIPKDHQQHIERYTRELTDRLEKVALDALVDRKPGRLSFGLGKVTFAKNRRTKGGPVDHDLPVLAVRDPQGRLRAVYVNYACHCVTLSNNKVSGDWAGYAQEQIEADYPGAVALVSIGCGADSNPTSGVTGDKADIARGQGAEIAREVRRLLENFLGPVQGKLIANTRTLELPLAMLPTRAQWEEKAKKDGAVGYHALVNLARLDRGEKPRTKIDYPMQTWTFGDSLAMVFMPGEVVVDYSLRLKKELNGHRLWINAYANDAPAYIPSEHILKEGGYEGGGAMIYYDVPVPFAPGLEQKIVDAVRDLVGPKFRSPIDTKKCETLPQSPQQSLAAIRTKAKLRVELVVAEPLVIDPVAIDFGPDGKLWVAEMIDYPTGKAGKYEPGGRIRVLEDTNGDGKFDKATVFLDNIPFPTGVTVWGKGILVCAAPDILYAEDTDGDGKADVVRKLFSGFGTGNYQARVNSLEHGLDGWVYGSCGMFGGRIECRPLNLSVSEKSETVALGDRDFRIKPELGKLEPASGRTQQGRVRDDWDNWFGCDNSTLCRHYPLADHYLRRNPHLVPPPTSVLVPQGPDPNRLFPAHTQLQLFKLSGPPGRTTAACGLGIYRDDLLGPQYQGNAFICEPVNLMVHRLVLSAKGSTFTGKRAAGEEASEFLTSTDPWCRPVQVRTGPDGALWIVDMYRYVIEHPRWIPPDELAKLDIRAGSTMGRIYRVYPADRPPRPWPRLDQLDTAGLVAALDSANGWQRDLAMHLLVQRGDRAAVKPLEAVAAFHVRPEARVHALCTLDGLGKLQAGIAQRALHDKHPGVRRHAVRLMERFIDGRQSRESLLGLLEDPDPQVRLQLAYTLGAWRDRRAGAALGQLAARSADDPYLTAAVLSSLNGDNVASVVSTVLSRPGAQAPSPRLTQQLFSAAVALGDSPTIAEMLDGLNSPGQKISAWQIAALTGIFDALDRQGKTLSLIAQERQRQHIERLCDQARDIARMSEAPLPDRLTVVPLLGREAGRRADDVKVLGELLVPQNAAELQAAAVGALGRIPDERVAILLTAGWKSHTPALRAQILDVLLSRLMWQGRLLEALEKKDLPASQIDQARRQRLLTHRDRQIRERAARVFAGIVNPDRQRVLQEYQLAVKLPGDSDRGRALFQKHCAACHRLGTLGHIVGPDLAALTTKTRDYLLSEILDPNKNVESRYVEYLATTKAGQTFTGVLAAETAISITLRGQEGKQQIFLRSELEELVGTGKSLMPEGIEKEISPAQMADLLAFLTDPRQTTKPGPVPRARKLKESPSGVDYRAEAFSKSIAVWAQRWPVSGS